MSLRINNIPIILPPQRLPRRPGRRFVRDFFAIRLPSGRRLISISSC
jgi:hypothetical protein